MYYLKYFIIYTALLINYSLLLISIPFKSINIENLDNSNFFNEALSKEIYINLSFSNPSKDSNSKSYIKTLIKINKNSFYLPQKSLSSSKIINKDKWIFASWANTILYFANDSFSFNIMKDVKSGNNYTESKSKNILNFLTKNELVTNEIYNEFGLIGLKLISNENETKYPDFLSELKRENIISKYMWNIKYNYVTQNYFEGEFIIGGEIEKYLTNNIQNDYSEFRMIKPYNRNNELYWDLKFKDILIDGKPINKGNNKYALQGTFEPKLNLIIGTTEFKNEILNKFFNDYIYKRICYEEKINFSGFNYLGISCKKAFNITAFPFISFRLQFYSFSFNYEDLFYEDLYNKDIYHFLIIFNNDNYFEDNNELWTFGIPFMNKYIFIFDSDQKIIQYYKKNVNNLESREGSNDIDNNYNNKENKENNTNIDIKDQISKGKNFDKIYIFIIIGIILGCVLLIIFGMKIQKYVIMKRFPTLNLEGRKKHKNELSCELEQMNRDNDLLISN